MRTRKFQKPDLEHMNKWLLKRDCAPVDLDDLAKSGFTVVDEKGIPMGCGFLRAIEGGFGIMDSLVNDPEKDSLTRHRINERLFVKILNEAKKYNLKSVLATSVDKSTQERGMRHGFMPGLPLFVWKNEKVN